MRGKPVKRLGNPLPVVEADDPSLRIISDDLWEAAQRVRQQRAIKKFGPDGKVTRRPVTARKEHLLSDKLRCGACGGHMRISQNDRNGERVACAAAHQHRTCEHRKSYSLTEIEQLIIGPDGMKKHLCEPGAIERFVKGYIDEARREENRDKIARADLAKTRREITNLNRQIETLGHNLSEYRSPTLLKELQVKEAQLASAKERLRLGEAETNVVTIHPNIAGTIRAKFEELATALLNDPNDPVARATFRGVMDSFIVHPTPKRAPYEVSPVTKIDVLLGVNLFPKVRTTDEILREQGVLLCSDNVKTVSCD
jgi:hypothetical protein